MGNGRKRETALWRVFAQGAALSLGIYLLLTALAAALLTGGVLPEAGAFPAAAVSCCLASWAGAVTCVRRAPWGSLPSAMTCAGAFLLTLIAAALLCWQRITWLGQGGALLLCGAGGGVLAGLTGGRGRRRGGRRVRPAGKARL